MPRRPLGLRLLASRHAASRGAEDPRSRLRLEEPSAQKPWRTHLSWPLGIRFGVKAEFLHLVAKGVAGDIEEFRGVGLVAAGLPER